MIIEANGSTSLVQIGNGYFLLPVGGSSGPQLEYSGTAVTVGDFGPWMAVGAEQTAGGYEVVWKIAATNQYTVWATDGGGNYLSNVSGAVSGNSWQVETRETTFNQDLNGDGLVGPTTTVIEAHGSTTLTQVADSYYFGGSSGIQLKYGSAGVTVGEFSTWTAIGAEQTAGGYEVVWKIAATNQFTVWATDGSGNYLSNVSGAVSGNSWQVETRETTFNQDLNGDGLVGPTTTVIEAHGSTTLTQVADRYYFGGPSGIQLKYGGAPVTAGQFGSCVAIGAEQTASGYEVVWKIAATNQFTVWATDSSGNYLSNVVGAVPVNSWQVETRETTYGQDLNGDGLIGPTTTVIEAFGSTILTQVADTYYFGGSLGVQLKSNGAPVTTGQLSPWVAIGAEQTATGYEIAWNLPGANQYTAWATDSSGNSLSAIIGAVSGISTALETLELSFHQDLNRDGVVGLRTTIIESSGATALAQVADTFYMYPVGGSSGPQLKMNGAPVTVDQLGPWTAIGAERTASGYEVAFRVNGADQYTVWNTDGNGNYVSDPVGVVSGGSSTLQSLETSFHQDLNNDGTIGSPTFDITVNYSGDPTYLSYFTAAAQRWQQIITADLLDVDSATYGHIDDLLISASVTSIDGRGGILGQAGPDLFRSTGSHLPYHGIMQFDSADLASLAANGQLYYVILHEMGHVLGFGSSLWTTDGLRSGSQYIGADAVNAYRQLGGGPTNSVPLETTGGSGTALVHWSESVFSNELMTGFISGTPDPLSILTVGAMQDLGYTVNYAAADPYSLPGHLVAQDGSASDGSAAIVASVGQLAGDFGNVGTVGLDTAPAPVLMTDEVGIVGPGGASVALLTNYIASTFPTPAAEGTGVMAAVQPPAQDALSRPAA